MTPAKQRCFLGDPAPPRLPTLTDAGRGCDRERYPGVHGPHHGGSELASLHQPHPRSALFRLESRSLVNPWGLPNAAVYRSTPHVPDDASKVVMVPVLDPPAGSNVQRVIRSRTGREAIPAGASVSSTPRIRYSPGATPGPASVR